MKKSIYTLTVFISLCSCHGGNMNEGTKVGPDTTNTAGKDSVHNSSQSHIDTAAAMLPTDTAPYKRKPDSLVNSHLKKNTGSSKNKIKK